MLAMPAAQIEAYQDMLPDEIRRTSLRFASPLSVESVFGLGFTLSDYPDVLKAEGGPWLSNERAKRLGLNAGLAWQFSPWLGAGLSAGYSMLDVRPSQARGQAAVSMQAQPLRWLGLGLAGDLRQDGRSGLALSAALVLPPWQALQSQIGCAALSGDTFQARVGGEAVWASWLALRVGWVTDKSLTLGAGFKAWGYGLDYAWLGLENGNAAHRAGLSYQFAPQSMVLAASPVPTPEALPFDLAPAQSSIVEMEPIVPDLGPAPTAMPTPMAPVLRLQLDEDPVAQGQALEAQGSDAAALEMYKKVLADDPKDAKAWKAMGMLYFKKGQLEYAKTCLKRALGANPEESGAFEALQQIESTPK
jgi:hypothetical protein